MIYLKKETEYALIMLSYLVDRDKLVSISEVVEATGMPRRFLARVAARLVKEEILDSIEGRGGGYSMTAKFDKISLYDLLKIFQPENLKFDCKASERGCDFSRICRHKKFFTGKLTKSLRKQYKKIKLKEIFK